CSIQSIAPELDVALACALLPAALALG
ncbi:hypothetical protein D030_0051B, partial [Vibrio parahaemolyticus AQ3810]